MMDYPKVPRHCLLPVFPDISCYTHPFEQKVFSGDWDWTGPIKWLREYADKLSDYVLVTAPRRDLIERIEAETGKRAIPTFCLDWSNDDGTHTGMGPGPESGILPSRWQSLAQQQEWLDYLRSRLDHWPWIMAANSGNKMDTNGGGHPTMRHIAEFCERFPDLAGKFAFAPWDTVVAGEAGGCYGALDQAPMLQHFVKHKSLIVVYMGMQVLYRTRADCVADGVFCGTLWLSMLENDPNWIPRKPQFAYPYKHLQDWHREVGSAWRVGLYGIVQQPMSSNVEKRREACSFSGIGYYTGAARHNLSLLVHFGYTGALFFVPADPGPEGQKQMDLYTTDVL